MTHGALGAATGLILRLPAWVISALQSAQPRPGSDSSDRLTADPHDDRLVNTTLGVTRASRLSAPVSVLVSFEHRRPLYLPVALRPAKTALTRYFASHKALVISACRVPY
jgi:hypothetical protein